MSVTRDPAAQQVPTTLADRLRGASPAEADRWMRAAVALLLRLQADTASDAGPPATSVAGSIESDLEGFVTHAVAGGFGRRWSQPLLQHWATVRSALVSEAQAQPECRLDCNFRPEDLVGGSPDSLAIAPRGNAAATAAPVGPPTGAVTVGLASLLRGGELAWDEEREIDWAIRWWSGARRAGLLGEHEMAGDFGLCWRAVEWSCVRLQLVALGQPGGAVPASAACQRRLAHAVRTATRYRELAPLVRLIEDLVGPMTVSGYSLR